MNKTSNHEPRIVVASHSSVVFLLQLQQRVEWMHANLLLFHCQDSEEDSITTVIHIPDTMDA